MRNEDIKLVIGSLREEMKAGHSLTRATVKSEVDLLGIKVDEIIEHNKRQNGELNQHEKDIRTIRPFVRAVRKKYFWIVAFLLLSVMMFAANWASEHINWKKTLKNTTGVSVIDNRKDIVTNVEEENE